MGKIAFVFSGQGAQYTGMGKDLAERSAAARAVFAALDEIRPGTSEQCFSADMEELCKTINTQPCMFAVELAAAAALREAGIQADLAAGFSLGELGALTYGGAMELSTGFRLVCKRAEHMQKAAELHDTGMAAVLKLDEETVREICAQLADTYPVNFNCPGQITVAAAKPQLAPLLAAVKAQGGRAVPLKVNAAFHSPFMSTAARDFSVDLEHFDLKEPKIPIYANRTAEPYGADVAALLAGQIDHPVLWEKSVRAMIAAGADTFLELGPGRTLCGLIAKTDPNVRVFATEKAEDFEKVLQEICG